MPVIEVWGEGRNDLWTPSGTVNVPKDYDYLPAGDAALTRAVSRGVGRKRLFAVMRKDYKRYPSRQVGVWAPASLIAAERERLAALRTEEHKAKLRRQGERRQERDIEAFAEAIRLRFPACPADEALAIARHACEVGSGRVGRSSTADDPVRAAVVAHIRHQHTDYEDLLDFATEGWMSHWERQEARLQAREDVREQVDAVLRRWQGIAEGGDTAETNINELEELSK